MKEQCKHDYRSDGRTYCYCIKCNKNKYEEPKKVFAENFPKLTILKNGTLKIKFSLITYKISKIIAGEIDNEKGSFKIYFKKVSKKEKI